MGPGLADIVGSNRSGNHLQIQQAVARVKKKHVSSLLFCFPVSVTKHVVFGHCSLKAVPTDQ